MLSNRMASTIVFRGLPLQRLGSACRPIFRNITQSQVLCLHKLDKVQLSGLSSEYYGNYGLTQPNYRTLQIKSCFQCSYTLTCVRQFSSKTCLLSATPSDSKQTSSVKDESKGGNNPDETSDKSLSVFQRFKKTYKEHGKVLVGVHLATSAVWFGSFFYAASVGVDVIPLMEYLGFSETIIKPFRSSSLGDVALAYLMYKLATPARYTVTLAGTNFMVKYLRRTGKMQPAQPSESLRSLAKDSRAEIKEKTGKLRSEITKRKLKVRKEIKANLGARQNKLRVKRNILQAQLFEKRRVFEHNLRTKLKRTRARRATK